jgi:hypothetical protein
MGNSQVLPMPASAVAKLATYPCTTATPFVIGQQRCAQPPSVIPKYGPYHCLIVWDLASWPNQLYPLCVPETHASSRDSLYEYD